MNQNLHQYFNTIISNELKIMGYSIEETELITSFKDKGLEVSDNIAYQESVKLESLEQGESRSIKNIFKFNLSGLFESLATFAITVSSIATAPWLAILGLLILIKQLYSLASVQLDETMCKVLWAIWLLSKESNPIDINHIEKRLNSELTDRSFLPLSNIEIISSLTKLETLGVVEQLGDEWELIDYIQINKEIKV